MVGWTAVVEDMEGRRARSPHGLKSRGERPSGWSTQGWWARRGGAQGSGSHGEGGDESRESPPGCPPPVVASQAGWDMSFLRSRGEEGGGGGSGGWEPGMIFQEEQVEEGCASAAKGGSRPAC